MSQRIYCSLPWYSIQLHFDKCFGPCCHIKYQAEKFPADLNDIMSLFNSKEMTSLRRALITGKLPIGSPCRSCYDRYFETNHDIFGMERNLPKYSVHDRNFDKKYNKANLDYRTGKLQLNIPPFEIYMFTSQQCNLDCIMCVQHGKKSLYPIQNIKHIIYELGWNNIDRLGWVGGETFFTKDSLEMLDFVADEDTKGTCIYLTTNGVLLNKHMDKLAKIDNLFLSVSMEGIEHSYKHIRKNSDWELLLKNLFTFSKIKKQHPNWRFNINSLVMKSSLDAMKKILELSLELDATVFYYPIRGIHPDENIFYFSDLVDYLVILEAINSTLDCANKHNAFKAADSLIKLNSYLRDTRKLAFLLTLLKRISITSQNLSRIKSLYYQIFNRELSHLLSRE